MKLHIVSGIIDVMVLMTLIFVPGCREPAAASPSPPEPGVKPPIIYTPVAPPPSSALPISSTSVSYNLTTSVSPSGAGTIEILPPGGNYPTGTIVTLLAVPMSGYQFDHWYGDVSGTSTNVTLNIDSNKFVTATFK